MKNHKKSFYGMIGAQYQKAQVENLPERLGKMVFHFIKSQFDAGKMEENEMGEQHEQ